MRTRPLLLAAAGAAVMRGARADVYQDVSFGLTGDIGRGASEVMSGWSLQGDAVLLDTFVRLTEDAQHKKGLMTARKGAHEVGENGWTVDVTVRVHGVGVSLVGDGLGLWYTSEPVRSGSLLGGPNRFHGLFLGLDTYVNSPDSTVHPHPYLGIAVNDGSELATHDAAGIHTSLHAPAGCSITQARQIGPHESRVVTLRIQYGGPAARWLSVKYSYGIGAKDYTHRGADGWTQCARLDGVDLPAGYHWGASAATGAVSDNHDVLSLIVHRGSADPPLAAGAPSPAAQPEVFQYQPPHPVIEEPAQPPAPQVQVEGSQCTPCPKQAIVVRPEMHQVEEAVKRSHFLAEFGTKVAEAETRLGNIRNEIEHRIDSMYQHMDGLLGKMSHTEEALEERLAHLESALRTQLDLLRAEHRTASSRWVAPFLGLSAAAAAIGLWGVKQYRAINKLHKY